MTSQHKTSIRHRRHRRALLTTTAFTAAMLATGVAAATATGASASAKTSASKNYFSKSKSKSKLKFKFSLPKSLSYPHKSSKSLSPSYYISASYFLLW